MPRLTLVGQCVSVETLECIDPAGQDKYRVRSTWRPVEAWKYIPGKNNQQMVTINETLEKPHQQDGTD